MFRFSQAPLSRSESAIQAPDDLHTLHYVLVVDRSGSMAIRMQEVLGAVNRQIETLTQESKASGSKCLLSVVRFDDEIEILHLEKPVEEVRPITIDMLAPRGLTALVDATTLSIERAAELFGNRIDGEKESLAMVIYTDGGENASRLRTISDLKTALKNHQDLPGWDIAFVGASVEAFTMMEQVDFARQKMVNIPSSASGWAMDEMSTLLKEKMNHKKAFDLGDIQRKARRK